MRSIHVCLGLISLVLILFGCGAQPTLSTVQPQIGASLSSAPESSTLTVSAAASLTEALTTIAKEFEASHAGVEVLLNFAGSQSLRLQIEQGAQADVFASANRRHAEALLEADLIRTPVTFAHNELVVITPADNPASIQTLADLTQPGIKLILAGPTVPVGRYARQALEKLDYNPALSADYSVQVLGNLVSEEENVKAVVAKVQLGEADAGIVYRSDVSPAVTDRLKTIAIPPNFNVTADYPIAVVSETVVPELAQQFIDFILSPRGQEILAHYSFDPAQSQPIVGR